MSNASFWTIRRVYFQGVDSVFIPVKTGYYWDVVYRGGRESVREGDVHECEGYQRVSSLNLFQCRRCPLGFRLSRLTIMEYKDH